MILLHKILIYRLKSQIQNFFNRRLFFFLRKNVMTQYICESILRSDTQGDFFLKWFSTIGRSPARGGAWRLWRKGGFDFNFDLRMLVPQSAGRTFI